MSTWGLREIPDTVNKISLAAAVTVFLTWSLIGILKSKLVNRVTLRFQMLIAFIDILRHLSSFKISNTSDLACAIIGMSINFSDHAYVAFNTLLAINAHLIFISRQRPKMDLYPLYTLVTVMYITILNLCYYSNGAYGRNASDNCFFRESEHKYGSKFYMMYLMEVPGVLYCGYLVFLVMFKFKERMSKLRIIHNDTYVRIGDEPSKPTGHIAKLYWRISMYPISCFMTLFPYFVGEFLDDVGVDYPYWYVFLYRICRRLPGTTNLFFTLYDPNFQLAAEEFFSRIKSKFIKSQEDHELYELKKERRPSQPNGQGTWFDQIYDSEEWKIEFHDGYRMTVQDHIKYL